MSVVEREEATGIKRNERLTSFYTGLSAYRVVATADGAVNPASPPDISLLDNRTSGRGENNLFVYADAGAGTATLQVWVITGSGDWYYVSEKTLSAGQPVCWLVEGLPALRYAVVVTASSAPVELKCAYTV